MNVKLLRGILNIRNVETSRRYVRTAVSTKAVSEVTANYGSFSTENKSKLKMNGWQIHCYGDVDELQFSDKLKVPPIKNATDCLVRVLSTTVNPIDVLMLGGYGESALNLLRCQPGTIEFPLTLGREFCGEIIQTGMGTCNKLRRGDRVWGVVPLHLNGAHADYVVVPEFCLSEAPSILSNEEAASVLYAGLTAWSGLYVTAGIGGVCGALSANGGGANKRVLVLGGSGSVGSLAIQILKAQGAKVVSTCSEDAASLVRGIGADIVIDYKIPEEVETLRKYAPYDVVLDCAGQGPKYVDCLNFSYSQYITFSSPLVRNIDESGLGWGLLKNVADIIQTNAKTISSKNQALVKWGFFLPAPQGILFLKQLVEKQKLLPIIDSKFSYDELPKAYQKVKDGHLRGKIVINLH